MTLCPRSIRRSALIATVIACSFVIGVASNALASGPALVSFNPLQTHPTPNFFVGYQFQPVSDITITALGAYDDNGDGLGTTHQVGIWDAGMTLLASVTVSTTDGLIGEYRYVTLSSPLSLTAGNDYFIAGEVTSPDPYVYEADTVVWDPLITFVTSVYNPSNVFGFPTTTNASREYMSVNFVIDSPVPNDEKTWGAIKSLYR